MTIFKILACFIKKKVEYVACIIFLLEFMDSSTPLNPTALKPTQAENSGLSLILWPESFLGGLTDSLLTSAASSSSLTSPSSVLLRLLGSFFPYKKRRKMMFNSTSPVILEVWGQILWLMLKEFKLLSLKLCSQREITFCYKDLWSS